MLGGKKLSQIKGISLIITDRPGALHEVTGVIASHGINITFTQQFVIKKDESLVYMELEGVKNFEKLLQDLKKLDIIRVISEQTPFQQVYGKRVIVIGGGAQVAQVALGAITEADRHNIRGEKISVDTIPLVGEKELAEAVRAVGRLHRAAILVLAGSLMGGEITEAVKELRSKGIPIISLSMAGSVPEVADVVITDPVQAGVIAVMAIADTARFDLSRVRGKRF
ncbi:MAG: DUF5612 domain-containing protein [Euryarchaeota archaeon]|nr:DUF5612 domain-containing protein [Euryarchaeota archaeon]